MAEEGKQLIDNYTLLISLLFATGFFLLTVVIHSFISLFRFQKDYR